jgi:hypothetical protein
MLTTSGRSTTKEERIYDQTKIIVVSASIGKQCMGIIVAVEDTTFYFGRMFNFGYCDRMM